MRILFIGGAGFIGSSLIKEFLKDSKYEVFVIEPSFANVSRLDGLDVSIFRESLTNVEAVFSVFLHIVILVTMLQFNDKRLKNKVLYKNNGGFEDYLMGSLKLL